MTNTNKTNSPTDDSNNSNSINQPEELALETTDKNAALGTAFADFDDDDIEELGVEDDRVAAALAVADALQRRIDPDQLFPRKFNAGKNDTFKWQDRVDTDIPELIDGNVVGLRGVIVKNKFGFGLYGSNTERMICQTVSSTVEGMPTVKSDRPMYIPSYSPQAFGTTNEPAAPLHQLNPKGSRGESCADCVRGGRSINRYQKLDQNGKPVMKNGVEEWGEDACGLQSAVIFCVMALAISRFNNVTRETTVKWVNVSEYVDSNGNKLFDGPFILNMQISRKPVMTPIGKKLQLKIGQGSHIPKDVLTLNSYISDLKDRNKQTWANGDENLHGVEMRQLNKDITEIYLAQPMQGFENQMIKSWPVFRSVTDPEVLGNWPVKKWVSFAWKVYEAERMAFTGAQPSDPAVLAAARDQATEKALAGIQQQERPPAAPTKVSSSSSSSAATATVEPTSLDSLGDVFSRPTTKG